MAAPSSGSTLELGAGGLRLVSVMGLNTNKATNLSGFLVDASGNVTVPGTLAVTGAITATGGIGSGSALTAPVITGGLTASGSASNDFSASTGSFKASTGGVTLDGTATSTLRVTGAGLTLGTLTSGTTAVVSAGLLTLTGVGASVWTPGAGATIVSDATTGIKIGTATTQKLGFYNVTPVVQPPASADVTGFAAGAGTTAKSDSVWTGASGASAYTVGGIVTALKALGLLAA